MILYFSADSSMLNNNTSDTMFETLSIEIEQLLKKLTMINNKMSDSIGVTEITDTSNANVHTLQRHREILRDYTHEYDKTKRNIVSFKEREKLLSLSNKNDVLNSKGLNNRRNDGSNNNNNNSTSLYLKEYDHLKK
jgi:Golgi SNAP receptor complex protein 1